MFMNSAQGITGALQAKTPVLETELKAHMEAILAGLSLIHILTLPTKRIV